MKRISESIRRARTLRRFSQRRLAEKAEINPSFLSLIECGKRAPSEDVIRSIANALDIPVDVLYWDAVEIPDTLPREDRERCELAKMIVTRFLHEERSPATEEADSR